MYRKLRGSPGWWFVPARDLEIVRSVIWGDAALAPIMGLRLAIRGSVYGN